MKTFQEWLLKEETAEKNSEGLYICPDCHVSMGYISLPSGRDSETMGGYRTEYVQCDKCKHVFGIIHGMGEPSIDYTDIPYQEEQ